MDIDVTTLSDAPGLISRSRWPSKPRDASYHLPRGTSPPSLEARKKTESEFLRTELKRRSKFYGQLDNRIPQIRVLSLQRYIHHGQKAVRGRLVVRPLYDRDDFDALSYAWGTEQDGNATVEIDGEQVTVTINLFDALWDLSVPGKLHRPVWVDAICINQVDVAERSQQVALMKKIFTRAEVVHIHLSDHNRTQTTFRSFEEIATGTSVCGLIQAQRLSVDAVSGLLNNQWWTRLWVLQEAKLAKDPLVHWGGFTIKFWTLINGLTEIRKSMTYEGVFQQDLVGYAGHWTSTLDTVVHAYQILKTPGLPPDVIMNLANGLGCSDERDRIYGLLGLMDGAFTLRPDYSLSAERVWTDATFAIMQHMGSVRILRLTNRRSLYGLSWVPSYAQSDSLIGMHAIAYGPEKDTCSGKFILERGPADKLGLNALIVDTVDEVSTVVCRSFSSYFDKDEVSARNTLRDWLQLAAVSLLDQKTGPDGIEASPGQAEVATFRKHFWQTILCEGIFDVIADDQTHDFSDVVSQYEEWLYDETKTLTSYLFRQLDRLIRSTTFFITKHRRMGITRSKTEKGDRLALLVGDDIPYLLRSSFEVNTDETKTLTSYLFRRVKWLVRSTKFFITKNRRMDITRLDTYDLQGPCFCHGLMHGEGIEESLVRRRELAPETSYAELWSPLWLQ